MITYQDFLQVGENDVERAAFVRKLITEHMQSGQYKTAKIAEDYYNCRNTTAMQYQRTITTVTGKVVPDTLKATHRSTSNFFHIFTVQIANYILGNGCDWKNKDTPARLGLDFDSRLKDCETKAIIGGVAYGFWNLDHLEVFRATEFAPLVDEENGALAAGARFWQLAPGKPLRATLYEREGYTDYLFKSDMRTEPDSRMWTRIDDGIYMQPRRPYVLHVVTSVADGERILDGENYPDLPIVPLWANTMQQSELVGQREKIDAYDFILNGWENDLDNAQIYWILKGAGGMDDIDLQRFLDRLHVVGAAAPDDGQEVSPVTVDIPYDAREKLLDRLERQLYKDAMLLNPADIAGGATTATQIMAAYEPQNVKADDMIYCILDFVAGITRLAGVDDVPTFSPSMVNNTGEEIQNIVLAAPYLSREYVTRKILSLLGDKDAAEDVLRALDADDAERLDFEAEGEGVSGNGDGNA